MYVGFFIIEATHGIVYLGVCCSYVINVELPLMSCSEACEAHTFKPERYFVNPNNLT